MSKFITLDNLKSALTKFKEKLSPYLTKLDSITGVVTADKLQNPDHPTDLVAYNAFQAAVPLVQSMNLTGAQVGQTIKVKTVNEQGMPTAWEAADMPGSGDEWELIAHINVVDDVEKNVTVWEYNNLPRYKYIAYKKVNLVGSSTQTVSGCIITINNESTQPSGMSYGKSGSPQSCIGMIYVTPFGWAHCKTGDSVTPTNYAFGGVNAMYNALPLSDNAITSIKLSENPTYKIASGEIWLYGKKG